MNCNVNSLKHGSRDLVKGTYEIYQKIISTANTKLQSSNDCTLQIFIHVYSVIFKQKYLNKSNKLN